MPMCKLVPEYEVINQGSAEEPEYRSAPRELVCAPDMRHKNASLMCLVFPSMAHCADAALMDTYQDRTDIQLTTDDAKHFYAFDLHKLSCVGKNPGECRDLSPMCHFENRQCQPNRIYNNKEVLCNAFPTMSRCPRTSLYQHSIHSLSLDEIN
jgi:hypothetical protein